MNFKSEIKKRLKGLNLHQTCRFAWVCGLRALPFLSAKRKFEYWPSGDRQRHLYSIFNALDTCLIYAIRIERGGYVLPTATAAAAAIVADAVAAAATAVTGIANVVARAVTAAVDTAVFAADAAFAFVAADAVYSTDAAADAAVYAAEVVANVNIESILLSDINKIRAGRFDEINIDINNAEYRKLWQDLEFDLKEIGCAYWAKIYTDYISNGLNIDLDSLKQRMSVPESIRVLGAKDVAANLSGPQKRLNEARIIILGEKGAGKTSLAKKLLNPEEVLSETQESTEGVDILHWRLPEKKGAAAIDIHIWDFAGHAITHTAHRYFLAENCVYIIVYNGREDNRYELEKWLHHAETYGGDSPVYVLTNLRDGSPVVIDENYLSDRFPAIRKNEKAFKNFSLRGDTSKVKDFRNELENLIRTSPAWGSEIPVKWFQVKEKLNWKFSRYGSELIKTSDFNQIANEAGIKNNEIESMKHSLHALGVCLWYDKIAELQTFVLKPGWISYGVYKIVNWLGKEQTYKLRLKDFNTVFIDKDAERYKSKHQFLFDLMKSYELAYSMEEDGEEWLILPSMLTELQPETRMEDAYPIKDSLFMRYRVTGVMPIDTITRFIVRHHAEIAVKDGKQVVWRRGVALYDKTGNEALVIEDRLEIRLSVKGKTKKTALEYFCKLRDTLDDIFDSYKNDYPEVGYVIAETKDLRKVYIDEETILAYSESGRLFFHPKINKEIDMGSVATMYDIRGNQGNVFLNSDGAAVAQAPGATAIAVSKVKLEFPHSVDKEQFSQILNMLEKFLNSEQADELTRKELRSMQAEIKEAKQLGHKKGWEKISKFLSDIANATTIVTNVSAFIANHPEIPQFVVSIFP